MESDTNITAIRNYVIHMNDGSRDKIAELIQKQLPTMQEVVVYRGIHSTFPEKNTGVFLPYFHNDFFSVSENPTIAYLFQNPEEECCYFQIHIQPGVRMLDTNYFLQLHGIELRNFTHEMEWLVEGGGRFFADSAGTIPGFKPVRENPGMYKTYYFPPVIKKGGKRVNYRRRL